MNTVLCETEGGQVWHCSGWQSVDDALASFNTNSRIPVKEVDLAPKKIQSVSSTDSQKSLFIRRGAGRGKMLREREFKLCPEKRDLMLHHEIRKANTAVSNAHLEYHYNNSSFSTNFSNDLTNEIRFTRSPKKSKAVKKSNPEEELSDSSSAVSGLDMAFAALAIGSSRLNCIDSKKSSCSSLNPDAPTFVPTENNVASLLPNDEPVEVEPISVVLEKSSSQKTKKKAQMRNCVFENLGKQKGLKLQTPSHFLETAPVSPSISYRDYEYNENDFPSLL